ncbi:hypothetical protein SteCoe_34173 [Stentor coeruleus]|uniref:Dynein axonemal assembly factor 5 TPR repeats domain-containing protein n=1 Tax=Stentor coeruleus TaxID=5963 RepID=A0A1R2AV29_9CILI|nr:hypothetical protein SteCoe_34173 [Stentor coeruleus]
MEEGKYNRDINCLRDRDKNTRLGGLQRILKSLNEEQNLCLFFSRLKLPLIDILSDPSDKCKELSVKILKAFVDTNSIPPEDLSYIIISIHSRIGQETQIETCEEVRISLMQVLFTLCKTYTPFIHLELGRITDIIAKACRDKCPQLKILGGELSIYISQTSTKIGLCGKKILEQLRGNMYHQQFKIRINALQAIGSLLICEGSQEFAGNFYMDFKKTQLDRKIEVCKALNDTVYKVLSKIPQDVGKEIEGRFSYLLLCSGEEVYTKLEDIGKGRENEESEHSGSRLFIINNLKELVGLALSDLQEWTLQDNYRTKAACALMSIVDICQKYILPHIEPILFVIFKTYSYDPALYLKDLIQNIGIYCDFPLLVSLFTRYCTSVNSYQDISASITLLIALIEKLNPEKIHLDPVISLISLLVQHHEAQVLNSIHNLINTLLDKFQASLPTQQIFSCLLILDSSIISSEIQSTLEKAAMYGGLSVQELYINNLHELLPKVIKNYKYWNNGLGDPALFTKLACRSAQGDERIISVACYNCRLEADDSLRNLMLDVIEACAFDCAYSQLLIEQVFIPTAAWKPNSVSLRKKSVELLIKLTKGMIVEPLAIKNLWGKLFPILKTCASDETAQLREVVVEAFLQILNFYSQIFEEIEICDLYPELLKRLDDSLDRIRIATAEPFCRFFIVVKENNKKLSNYNYIVGSLFTHLDDPSEYVQKAITRILQSAGKFSPEEFLILAREAEKKHKHPRAVSDLINLVKTF